MGSELSFFASGTVRECKGGPGVVEPQMRKALHIHMLIQLLGFSHPQDLFGNSVLPDIFRRLWYFVASISFRSTEAFAAYLQEDAAMVALAQQPLLPLTKKQRGMIGEERARESERAQLHARGLSEMPAQVALPGEVYYFASQVHVDREVTSANWAAQVTVKIASMTRRAGLMGGVCHQDYLVHALPRLCVQFHKY